MRFGSQSWPADRLFDWHALHQFGQAGTVASSAGSDASAITGSASIVFDEFRPDSTREIESAVDAYGAASSEPVRESRPQWDPPAGAVCVG
jgi:hypothetical protein